MTTIESHLTLATIVTAEPATAAVFERLGIDYCCGGNQRLDDAVAAAGLDLGATIGMLDETVGLSDLPEVEWASLAPGALADHIESTHHAYLHEELPRLCALAEKVATVHGERHPELAEVFRLTWELRQDLEPHLMKEERVLFPLIRSLGGDDEAPAFHCGSVQQPIQVMLMEHDRTGELLTELRAAARGYVVPDDGCGSYRALYEGLAQVEADTHLHVHKENNILFPAAIAAEGQVAPAG